MLDYFRRLDLNRLGWSEAVRSDSILYHLTTSLFAESCGGREYLV